MRAVKAGGYRQLLGGLTPAAFLARHWQRNPYVVTGAFAGVKNPLSPEELAGLACDTDLPARLVYTQRAGKAWQVAHGPFEHEDFLRLPKKNWTLLVQGVDRLLPEVQALRARFDFLPAWRLDDVMVSYAAPGGSVGPHVDSYDVFLLQLHGQRRWQVSQQTVTRTDLRTDTPLRVLKHFRAEQEWLLGPGDMLYLPPGVAHYGVAEGPCMTYSIGFRAPSAREVWSGYLEHLLAEVDADDRYQDPDLTPVEHPGRIDDVTLTRLLALLETMPRDRERLADWLGQHVTEVGPGVPPARRTPRTERVLDAVNAGRSQLLRALGQPMAWRTLARGTRIYAAGRQWTLTGRLASWARSVADLAERQAIAKLPEPLDAAAISLLSDWLRLGVLQEKPLRRRAG